MKRKLLALKIFLLACTFSFAQSDRLQEFSNDQNHEVALAAWKHLGIKNEMSPLLKKSFKITSIRKTEVGYNITFVQTKDGMVIDESYVKMMLNNDLELGYYTDNKFSINGTFEIVYSMEAAKEKLLDFLNFSDSKIMSSESVIKRIVYYRLKPVYENQEQAYFSEVIEVENVKQNTKTQIKKM